MREGATCGSIYRGALSESFAVQLLTLNMTRAGSGWLATFPRALYLNQLVSSL